MDLTNHQSWLKSSQSPDQISNTVRGFVLAFSGAILAIGHLIGVPLTETGVAQAASQLGLAAGAIWFFYGVFMKGVMILGKRR